MMLQNKSLYTLTEEYLLAMSQLEDEECDADVIIEDIKLIEDDLNSKLNSIGKIIRMLELEAQDAKAEASRMAAMAKTADNRAKRLRQAVFEMMEATGQTKIKTQLFRYSVHATADKVNITDLDAVWEAYHKAQPRDESQIDKAQLKSDLQAGVFVPGAELVEGKALSMR